MVDWRIGNEQACSRSYGYTNAARTGGGFVRGDINLVVGLDENKGLAGKPSHVFGDGMGSGYSGVLLLHIQDDQIPTSFGTITTIMSCNQYSISPNYP